MFDPTIEYMHVFKNCTAAEFNENLSGFKLTWLLYLTFSSIITIMGKAFEKLFRSNFNDIWIIAFAEFSNQCVFLSPDTFPG